jgi:hypothetical protein
VSRTVRWQKRLERTGTDASVSKYIFGSFVAGQKNKKEFQTIKKQPAKFK